MKKSLVTALCMLAVVVMCVGVFGLSSGAQSAEQAVQTSLVAATIGDLQHDTTVDATGAPVDATAAEEPAEPQVVTAEDGTQYAQNELLLMVDAAASTADVAAALEAEGAQDVTLSLVMDGLSDGQSIVEVSYAGEVDAVELGERVAGSAGISTAEPNCVSHLADAEVVDADDAEAAAEVDAAAAVDDAATVEALASTSVNDPDASEQWALTSVNAYNAWDYSRAEGQATVVVIDSGVDYDHPDLADNLILDYAKNTYTNRTGGAAVDDQIGHGTHVSGIIAASANNAIGVAGVSYNAKVLPVKATYDTEGNLWTSDIIAGVEYALDLKADSNSPDYLKNIRVINLSLGTRGYDITYEAALNKAYNAGVLVVAAAGNENLSSVDYPAAYDNVMGISALRQSAGSASGTFDTEYSNYGTGVAISAPGTLIYSTYLKGGYAYMSGTSMATPAVSGAAALLFAKYPDATPAQVRAALQDSAVDLGATGWDRYYGYGALDACAAIAKLAEIYEHTHVAGAAVRENEVEATCTEAGSYDMVARCIVCGKVMQSEHFTIPATGHDWGEWESDGVTCTKAGYQIRYCSVCESYEQRWSEALGHNWGAWWVDIQPTKTAEGLRLRMCERCFKVESETIPALETSVTRLAGGDAFGTMTEIVEAGFEDNSCDTVILATFDGYWDALSAAGLAGAYDCPVLLTDTNSLSSAASAQIKRLGARNVVIAGGTAAVSERVADQVRALGCSVSRAYGANAIGTSVAIYEKGAALGAWGDTCIVATVNGYYDALSASPYSYAQGAPIFLANADGTISSEVTAAIKEGGFKRVVIAGGTACVTQAAANKLSSATGATIKRCAGENCFETSVALAELCLDSGMTADGACFATGLGGYWDALSGAAFAGKNGSPLLLVDNGHTEALVFLGDNVASVYSAYVFGGKAVVSDSMFSAIETIVQAG